MRRFGVRRAFFIVSWMLVWGTLFTGSVGAAANASAPNHEISMEEIWIPMPDGVRLAADLYMPTGGGLDERFPVLLEYLPYRKTESRSRNYSLYSYFVRRGYVVARVDIRGTGNSEGRLIPYEYSDQENEDGEVVIDWLSKQSWSNGNVGMFGISWGGFNSIHLAMRNPPALKAIIAVDATDDLYQDDVHFMDGIMHVDSWEMSQDLDNARPGAPDYSDRRGLLSRSLRHRAVDDDLQASAARRPLLGSHRAQGPLRLDSRARPSSSVAGTTATATACRACSSTSRRRSRRSSVPGRTPSRTTPTRSRRSSGGTRPCAGSTTG